MSPADFSAAADQVAATYRETAGEASAHKRGRNPVFPYVPVILHPNLQVPTCAPRQEQILGRAYVTREEAVSCAVRVIDARVFHFRRQLQKRGARALREQYGLPRELPEGVPCLSS